MQITTAYNIQMVDACHIRPFAESHDDTIQNGIPLCPNLHRAFDRGLLTINSNYQVIASPHFSEGDSSYALRQYEGITILLPQNNPDFPAIENLAWHQQYIFKA